MSFKTLPDVRAVKFDIQYEDRDSLAPGYWFVSPYLHMDTDEPHTLYEQYQIGPHIYDQEGRLVWTGTSFFDNRNTFDFKVVQSLGEEPHLSLIRQYSHDAEEDGDRGYGVILNNHYEITHMLPLREDLGWFDIHEFNVLKNGETALVTNYLSQEITLEAYGRPTETTWLEYGGFSEIDLKTAEILYHWNSFVEIPLTESVHYNPTSMVEALPGWDYVHINSVDKNDNGDYLISMRFTNTIYLISAQSGSIMWRLGGLAGNTSDFIQDFTFSKQHDAKFISSEGTRHVISILNNASDEEFQSEDVSSALIVEIEAGTEPKTAHILHRYERPDKSLTRLRGNSQVLPNKNMFACWSKGGYISEYAEDGRLLMSAQFTSPRYSNYRAYKFEFTGRPNTPPDLVASVYGTDEANMVTTVYVSWNGATDIAEWQFYAQASEFDERVPIGRIAKTDFETMFIAKGFMDWISVEAVDASGAVLGTSDIHRSAYPDWQAVGYPGISGLPRPNDPAGLHVGVGASLNETSDEENIPSSTNAMADAELRKATHILSSAYETMRKVGGILALIILLGGMAGVMACFMLIRGWRVRLYQRVRLEDGLPEEQTHLRPEMAE
ncbi:hypothetical protein N7468_006849 [Penicillium chermesinum]|uniref:ASST-domain-containing protein n=1 Tax=Penicillium chermesinum TaxID=63820 RepID=A0A9W9NVT4_9EURO|nr:uncharacterized protein N7468_006849 [Penicillium chermesinum]KAJ5225624.1 hypothetical protein N7468_006849 [Penicillium chermesinum]